jgi:hypothetical protein
MLSPRPSSSKNNARVTPTSVTVASQNSMHLEKTRRNALYERQK